MIEHARDSAASYMDMSGRDIASALLDLADRANLEDASLYREAAARLTCPPPKKDPTKVFVTIEVDTSKVDAATEKVNSNRRSCRWNRTRNTRPARVIRAHTGMNARKSRTG